jgi:hypothetical protein
MNFSVVRSLWATVACTILDDWWCVNIRLVERQDLHLIAGRSRSVLLKDYTNPVLDWLQDSKQTQYWLKDSIQTTYWLKDSKQTTYWLKDSKQTTYWLKDFKQTQYWLKDSRQTQHWLKDSKQTQHKLKDSKQTQYWLVSCCLCWPKPTGTCISNAAVTRADCTKSNVGQHGPPTNAKVGSGAAEE